MVDLTKTTDIAERAVEAGRQRMIRERQSRRWTYDDFAAKTGVARSTLSSICSGSDKLNLRVAIAVAKALEISLDDLLDLGTYTAPQRQKRIVATAGRVDLTGLEGRAPVEISEDMPELGLQAGDIVLVDTNAMPQLRKLVVVKDHEGARLYRVRSLDPMILERSGGPASVYDERYHDIIAVGVSLFRDL